jgi:hypothetical protein
MSYFSHKNLPFYKILGLLHHYASTLKKKQQGALKCCYIPTRLHGITSQRTVILTFITIPTILHFNTNNATEHIHIYHNLRTVVTKKLYIVYSTHAHHFTYCYYIHMTLYCLYLLDLPWWYHILYHNHHKITTKVSGSPSLSLENLQISQTHKHNL